MQFTPQESANCRLLSDDTFDQLVVHVSDNQLVLVVFWGPWCRLCRDMIPQLEQVVNASAGQAVLCLANVQEMRSRGESLGMKGLPSTFAFRKGKCVDHILGAALIEVFEDWVEDLLSREDLPRETLD